MIPVQLAIKGLYSYTNAVTIDFEPLVSAKLFGIFGPVGSGKSTILEAIMFVLFDRTTRLNKAGDDRYYNMMNLQSNEMSIDFIFLGGKGNKSKFRFYFLARRSSKDFRKVEVKDRSYYQWQKSDWRPLTSPEVLGMSYENFMQTVIIPQGKFRDFIDQKPTARTEMLKELFHLDQFDIAPKAFQMLGQVKERFHFLNGQLSQFQEISKTILKKLSEEKSALQALIKVKTEKEALLSEQRKEMERLKHLHHDLLEVVELLDTLEKEKEFFQQKEHQLKKFVKTHDLFNEKIIKQKELLNRAREKKQEIQEVTTTINKLNQEVSVLQSQWKSAQERYASKDLIQQKIADISILIQQQQVNEKLKGLKVQERKLETQTSKVSSANDLLKEKIEKARKASLDKAAALSELNELAAMRNWLEALKLKEHQLNQQNKELLQLNSQLEKLESEKAKNLTRIEDGAHFRTEITEARNELHSLLVQQDWQSHAEHLKEGKPCPLCGSLEHPQLMTTPNLSKEINSANLRIKSIERNIENLRVAQQQIEILDAKTQEKKKQVSNAKKNYQTLLLDLEQHKSSNELGGNPPELPEIVKQIKSQERIIKASAGIVDQLDEWSQKQKELETEQSQQQQQLQVVTAEIENLQGQTIQLSEMIKSLDKKDYLGKPARQLEQAKKRFADELLSIDSVFDMALKDLSKAEERLNQLKGTFGSLEIQAVEINEAASSLESDLQETCNKESFDNLGQVRKILELRLNVDVERKEIEAFKSSLNTTRIRSKTLRSKMGRKRYNESDHHKTNAEFDNLSTELKKLGQQLTSKQITYDQYKSRLKTKGDLQAELADVTERKDNIQEICNLLRGNGFINFISSVYLQNLCRAANERFKKLTGNRLSLELSAQNEFLVRDHLNEGKLRLLKTLSGGQIFQASLSLALSLAENVKNLNQADQSFFFLDEGFGSLDRNSLQLVFESLKTLQQENRIVGVISHVEDLQMEIDTFLSIRQDPEKGSIVSRSWE